MRPPPVLLLLVAVFAAVETIATLSPGAGWRIFEWAAFDAGSFPAALRDPARHPRAFVTLVTHAFLHAGWLHLAFNSLVLLHLGSEIVRWLGAGRFLLLFVLAAAMGAITHGLLFGPQPGYAVGASGAVFGMAAARVEGMAVAGGLQGWERWRFRGTQAMGWMLANALIYATLLLLVLRAGGEGGLAAWKAHLGGYVAGAVLAPLLARHRPAGRGR